jgi:RsiW-degrading membrane proteinase PrsW (M82 family)
MQQLENLGLNIFYPVWGACLVYFLWVKGRRHALQWYSALSVFVGGAFSVLLAVGLERLLSPWILRTFFHQPRFSLFPTFVPNSLGTLFLAEFLRVGLVEESAKLLVVVLAICWLRSEDPAFALILGTIAGFGFTVGENAYHQATGGLEKVAFVMFWSHSAMSSFWAAALGLASSRHRARTTFLVLTGLLTSALVHGLWDFFAELQARSNQEDAVDLPYLDLMQESLRIFLIVAFVLMAVCLERQRPKRTAAPK